MALRREQVYVGPMVDPGGTERNTEVWWNGETAIIFDPYGTQLATIRDADVDIGADGKLHVSGGEGEWVSRDAEKVRLVWPQQDLRWPDGRVERQATVKATQFRALVYMPGKEPESYLGARATVRQNRRTIETSTTRISAVNKGCGSCGGKR